MPTTSTILPSNNGSINSNEEQDLIIINIKNFIDRFKNIILEIEHHIKFINLNQDSNNEENKKQLLLYLTQLKELYNIMPSTINERVRKKWHPWLEKLAYPGALLLLASGIVTRVAQRNFSIEVVSNPNLQNQTFIEQIEELSFGMKESILTTGNYWLATSDTFFTFFISLFPFGLKHIIELFNSQKKVGKIELNPVFFLSIIVQLLEKSLELKNYEIFEQFESQITSLCEDLENKIEEHKSTSHTNESTTSVVAVEQQIKELNDKGKTDLTNEDYSLKQVVKNGLTNSAIFTVVNGLNHIVITLSSAYTAQTFTWEKYLSELITPANIFSTLARGTLMKLVNDHLIKKPIEKFINGFLKYYRQENSTSEPALNRFKNHMNKLVKQYKPCVQGIIVLSSFLSITFATNFIKTLAADVTQNKGDFKAAMAQLNKTFWKWEMALIALGVTASDMINLKMEMKKVFPLFAEKKKQKAIIDKIFTEDSSLNEVLTTPVPVNNNQQESWSNNMTNEVNSSSDTSPLISSDQRTTPCYGSF
ncbi:hypothetical protein [Spiroplasma endosymbiont of Nebria brevicollis]|uniref:hypothetical protein n=1 Tax=Spiroplasma endosymbiont of Nebria brevicollis TaxID=3066284 RepID=UPI00313AEC38